VNAQALPRVDTDSAAELLTAAAPIIDQLGDDLAGTDVGVVLSDESCRVIGRAPSDPTSCATTTLAHAPIVDIRTGRTLGSIALVSDATLPSPLLIPIARSAAREIERSACEGRSESERLESQFVRARRRCRGPLAVVGEHTLLVNAAAAPLLTAGEVAHLWPRVRNAIAEGALAIAGISGADGALLDADIEFVRGHDDIVGAILRFRASNRDAGSRRSSERGSYGWNSLTDAERGLAELIGRGMTNKEIAAELFLSRHTVDTHLRHIYRKLDIKSRVELARLVALLVPAPT
jgi:DNA-binding CsgD family transcriptional regulator